MEKKQKQNVQNISHTLTECAENERFKKCVNKLKNVQKYILRNIKDYTLL